MQIWRDGEADKLTQLVFCDISTPQARPAKKVAKALDNRPSTLWRTRCRWTSRNRPLRSTRTSGRSSSLKVCPPSRLPLSMRPTPRCAKRSCSPRSAPARCASCWAARPRWVQAPTCRIAWWRCMTWTARGGPATWPSERAALSAKATRTRLSMCTAMSLRGRLTPTSGRRWKTNRNSSARL